MTLDPQSSEMHELPAAVADVPRYKSVIPFVGSAIAIGGAPPPPPR